MHISEMLLAYLLIYSSKQSENCVVNTDKLQSMNHSIWVDTVCQLCKWQHLHAKAWTMVCHCASSSLVQVIWVMDDNHTESLVRVVVWLFCASAPALRSYLKSNSSMHRQTHSTDSEYGSDVLRMLMYAWADPFIQLSPPRLLLFKVTTAISILFDHGMMVTSHSTGEPTFWPCDRGHYMRALCFSHMNF